MMIDGGATTRPDLPAGDPVWMLPAELACESPIEEAFLHAMVRRAAVRRVTVLAVLKHVDGQDVAHPVTELFGFPVIHIRPQVKWGRYRFDFLLNALTADDDTSPLVVECDGHDYHERTKEQAARDRSRDRQVQAAGALVFRFTGAEIHADADGCADQCIEYLLAKVMSE